ncbi:DoxX family protein [Carboxylicivirga mesophila]|uniref:DoxX family protein n=1 Tax=Carboxylicivirga mesophila TaxID=1166478 RepID=A0ABS5K8K6_9BACT|nr:DoxX family protein [Carboxylicivirga mesophila]MBS2211217.1 DoxX family protein [Carboxylicivirga mesophila]
MKDVIKFINNAAERTGDWALLAMRLTLAFGLFEPAVKKFENIRGTAEWFSSLHFPLPTVSVLLAATVEFAGFFLLMLGLLTRYITIPLMFVMLMAILMVHLGNGFSSADNGIEIPFYYLVMLFLIFSKGPGRFSIDEAVVNKIAK